MSSGGQGPGRGAWRWNVRSTSIRRGRTTRCLRPSTRLLASPANVSGAEGPQRIAPAKMASQGDSHIPPGVSVRSPAEAILDGPDAYHRSSVGLTVSGADTRLASLRGRLTPTLGPTYHPPDDDAPCAPRGTGRVYVPLGEDGATVPEVGSRGSQDRPDEADVPAQEAPSCQGARLSRPHEDDRGMPAPGHGELGAGTADRLTTERGTCSPRLVMLSTAGLRGDPGEGNDQVPPCSPPGSYGTTSRRLASGSRPDASWEVRSFGTGSAADSERRSG